MSLAPRACRAQSRASVGQREGQTLLPQKQRVNLEAGERAQRRTATYHSCSSSASCDNPEKQKSPLSPLPSFPPTHGDRILVRVFVVIF